MFRKRKRKPPPKRRSPIAAALRSPALRQRKVPSAKRYKRKVSVDIETRSGLCVAEHAMMVAALDGEVVLLHDIIESF